MRTKSFLCLLLVCMLPLLACGLLQPGYTATQTTVAQTTVAVSWTDTPMPTATATFTPTSTATITATPDPCLLESLPASLEAFNEITTRFNAVSTLGFYQTREQLSEKMPELRELRQAAQDQAAPPCLETIKEHQLKYMDLMIEAFTAYIDRKDMLIIHNTVVNANKENEEYSREMRDLLNSTPTPEAK